MALLILPRVVLPHLKAGFRAALRPDPVMIGWWTQPALPTPVKQCRPSSFFPSFQMCSRVLAQRVEQAPAALAVVRHAGLVPRLAEGRFDPFHVRSHARIAPLRALAQ